MGMFDQLHSWATGLLHDPHSVQQTLAGSPKTQDVASRIGQGQSLIDSAKGFVQGGKQLLQHGADAAGKVLEPASKVGPPILEGLHSAGKAIMGNPMARNVAIGGLLTAPILAGAFNDSTKQQENELMAHRRDPGRMVTAADLDLFLEKKASPFGAAAGAARAAKPPATMMGTITNKAVEGIGGGIGKGIVDAAIAGIGHSVSALKTFLITDNQRKQLVESLMRTDPVLKDAIRADPKAANNMLEAFQTLVRFAPSLSTDPNAVRSFLREAVVSGAGVNYATIKNLAETEKSIRGDRH